MAFFMLMRSHRPMNEATKAAFFMMFIIGLIFVSFLVILLSGPIVVGTEMNTNGLVEYLCLGKGCENLYPMS